MLILLVNPRDRQRRHESREATGLAISDFGIRNSDFRLRVGWTLIETIAVLAVFGILGAVVVPPIIKRVDRAAWTAETANLNAMADSFNQSILRTKTIPSHTTWASAVASQMSLPVSAISTNARRYARAFYIDQNLSINGAGLPYTQTNSGATKPAFARVMIVSSLATALPSGLPSGRLSTSDFDPIWNAPEGAKPSTWTAWAGSGEDLRIKKLNLEPLFHQLILVNHDQMSTVKFSIDGLPSPAKDVPSGGLGWSNYYLDGSVVGLHDASGVVQTRYLLKRSISFVFESGGWRGQLQGGQPYNPAALDFLSHATTFFNQPMNQQAQQGASQFSVMLALYTFMYDYTLWANECPHFDDHYTGGNPPSPSSLPEYIMLNNQGQNGGNIDNFSGTSGLLK